MTVVTCEELPPVDGAGGALIVGGDVTALGSMVVGAVGTTPVLATVYTRFCAEGAAGTASVLDPTEGYIAVKTWLLLLGGTGGVEAGDTPTCPGARIWLCPAMSGCTMV